MAKPPVPSLVVKTAKPTTAQTVQQARAQQAKFNAGLPDPRALPNLTMVSPATGATLGSASRRAPVNDRGFVASPSQPVKTLLRGVKPTPNRDPGFSPKTHVKVTVHPNGKIEVHAPAASTPTSTAPASIPASLPKGKGSYQTDSHGRTDTTFNPRHPGANRGGTVDRVAAHAGTGPPLTIEDQAQKILDPVKQAILDAINQRLTAQQGAITNYSKDLAQMMGQYGPAAQAAYGNAQTGQAAVDAALAQTLSGAGNAGQAELAGKLAKIDADPGTAARINGAAAGATQGAASAAAGRGAASLSDLISRGAAAGDYGAKLPGVAGLYGLQATKSAQAQGTTDTANAVSQVEQQLPTIVNQIRTNEQQQSANETTRALAATQALGKAPAWAAKILGVPPGTPSAAIRTATARATAAAGKVDATLSKAYGVQTNSQGEAITGKDGKPIPYPTGGSAAPKVDLSLSDRYGILVDAQAQPILRNGKPVLLPKKQGTAKTLSAGEKSRQTALALGAARTYHQPWTDSNGATNPPLSWQQFLTHGLGAGIDVGILIDQGKRIYTQAEIRQGLIPGQGK